MVSVAKCGESVRGQYFILPPSSSCGFCLQKSKVSRRKLTVEITAEKRSRAGTPKRPSSEGLRCPAQRQIHRWGSQLERDGEPTKTGSTLRRTPIQFVPTAVSLVAKFHAAWRASVIRASCRLLLTERWWLRWAASLVFGVNGTMFTNRSDGQGTSKNWKRPRSDYWKPDGCNLRHTCPKYQPRRQSGRCAIRFRQALHHAVQCKRPVKPKSKNVEHDEDQSWNALVDSWDEQWQEHTWDTEDYEAVKNKQKLHYKPCWTLSRELGKGRFFYLRVNFFTNGWFLLLTVNWLGFFYLLLKYGLVFFVYGGNRFGVLLTVPPWPEIRFGFFCLRFPLAGNWVWCFCLRFPHRK